MNEPKPPMGRFAAFWTSLPGVLTAIAGLIAAIAGLLALFVVPGGDNGSPRAEWADKVDPICSEAADALRAIPISATDVTAQVDYLHQVGTIARGLARDVRAIEAPAEDQGSVDHLTALWDQQADGADAIALDLQAGNLAGVQSGLRQVKSATTEGDSLANSLGVTACAQQVQPSISP